MTQPSTLVDLLRERSQLQSDLTAYTFLADGKNESGTLTYATLDLQARAIAAAIQALTARGTNVLVVYPYDAGLEFVSAFFGCLYAGVVAVTDNPPRKPEAIAKLQIRAKASEATVLVSTAGFLEHLKNQLKKNPDLAPYLNQLTWLATDTVPTDQASAWTQPELETDTLAFLQYTSGSTGDPKGVMVTHGNMLHNSKMIYESFGHSDQSQGVIWLPLFHDMGLVGGVLQPLYGGFPVTLMSPIALIQKPILWLEAVSKYGATTSGGPNFAYDLLCQKVKPQQRDQLDLSKWEVAFSGAEPIKADTLDQFVDFFGPCGFRREAFYPCYGMAETTLFISGGLKSEPPIVRYLDSTALAENKVVPVEPASDKAQAIIGCGRMWLGDQVAIANPDTLTKCAENQVGEIWVAGDGVGKGYWNKPDVTAETFQARLADTGEGPFLRTGDLGFVQDGEVYITGRIKDLMIIWGRNQYPQLIEQTVEQCHPALRPNHGAAFSIPLNGEEHLVIVHEVERNFFRRLPVEEVIGAIRLAIAEDHMAEVYAVLLLKPGAIPKTSSGKIQRRACRTKFLESSFQPVAEWKQETQGNISDLMAPMAANQP
ncbi:fatty acyl-AMP ligase [Acaryochloris sp. CCMEE 5410]|uniref:fatty acyl-AMP ligase n=1 Tax=Acaryochloris sp. CCMEE 5410 TaxID=310037 RepID=UPI0002483C65|nr:fatty acyl-AMP ligase [Acaryochloris sp. CCMEE 5410]KAI9130692.1 fatty acyl-AMP ligase [Acaryochloris sp. CCMEE 5410]